jgi:hypothetical protein
VVCAKRVEFWETITAVLNAMAETHGDAFNTIMRECCRLSNSRPEIDGLDDVLTTNEQAMFDAALDREARRDTKGYVTPAQARAFLQGSRRIDLRHGTVPPRDPITRAHFRSVDRAEPAEEAPPDALSAIVDLLREAGVIPEVRHARRALLEGPQADAPRLGRIRAHLLFTQDDNPDAYATRSDELAYLANVIAAGATVQSRSVAAEEASKAAVAVCNLGLENWPLQRLADGALPEDLLIAHDLVSVFQVGWTILHEDVCMYAADALIGVLASLRCADNEIQAGLATLRTRLIKHWRAGSPWHARDGLDVIAILDTPSWAALLGLIAEMPTMHAALGASLTGTTRQVDASAFEFISENAQIQQVREFMQRLPQLLRS